MAELQISGLPTILGADILPGINFAVDDESNVTYKMSLLALFAFIVAGLNLPSQGQVITGSQSLVGNAGYLVNAGSTANLTLPTTISPGDQIQINGYAGGWKIVQNSGQQILWGTQQTTLGATGFLASTQPTDCVTLQCVIANTTFIVIQPQGNITVN